MSKSLYVKFIILILTFASFSMGVQWWFSRRLTSDSKPNENDSRNPRLVKEGVCVGAHCILNGVTGDTLDDIIRKIKVTRQQKTEEEKKSKGQLEKHSNGNKLPTKEPYDFGKVEFVSKLYDTSKIDEMVENFKKVSVVEKLHLDKAKRPASQILGIQYGDLNITSKLGLLVKDEQRVGIWNMESGKDRILEQMVYIPKQISDKPKVILASGGSGSWDIKSGTETFKDHRCRVQNCKVIDSFARDDSEVDAVLLGKFSPDLGPYIEKYRKPDVVWLFFALESPMATGDFTYLKEYVNWTASYRQDSTIVAPYEKWVYHINATGAQTSKRNYAKGKSKMAAIFVSNCAASNDRLNYVKDLQKYISVDIYGFCGALTCPRGSDECSEKLNKDYKFYLAFENANCKDYVTEKYFVNGLQHDVIPVVMGARRGEYEKVSPPHSFIHVEDFESPKLLAAYLQKLDQNDQLYNDYFKWKGTGSFLNTKFWCRLCALLNEENKPKLSVNVETWWRKDGICKRSFWGSN